MRFDAKAKGRITQKFIENANSLYQDQGLIGHTAVDYTRGFGTPVLVDNRCMVYKVVKEGQLPSNWAAVYTLVDDGVQVMEVCYGHLSQIDVTVGQWLEPGDIVGLEGNRGDVFHGGIRITPEMQKAGDKRGSHVHESWRPVKRVATIDEDEHYLRKANGDVYMKNSYAFQIMYNSPQLKGYVDPLLYAQQEVPGTISSLQKQVLVFAYALLDKLKK